MNSDSIFISKVYLLLILQLFITFGTLLFIRTKHFNAPIEKYWWILFILSLVLVLALSYPFKNELLRYSFMIMFCIVIGMILFVSTKYNSIDMIKTAFMGTVLIFITFSIVGLLLSHLNINLSSWGKYLLGALIGLIVFGLILIFYRNNISHKIYIALSLILFCIFVVYDTNRLLLKEEKSAINASISFFLDFLNLFAITNNN